MDEWRIAARLWVEAIRAAAGLRLILWGLYALPEGRVKTEMAEAAAKIVWVEAASMAANWKDR